MIKWKNYWSRGVSFLLVAAMLSTGNVSTVAAAASQKQQKNKVDEAQLREAIRDGKQMVKEYPNGLFNFLGTQMEVKEGDGALEIAVIRQGGTEGSEKVKFKAIDITSSYGDDYKIYVGKSRFSALRKGKDAFPLIKTAMEKKVDLSQEDATETETQTDGESLVEDAMGAQSQGQPEVQAVSAAVNPLDQYPDASADTAEKKTDTVKSENAKADSKGTSLKVRRETATGKKSDRPNWKIADNSEKADEVKENFELFMDSVGGTEKTLNFKDGEYVKYLYLVPKDDKISEGEEQLVCALLPEEDSAPVGDSYNAYVNIKDNDAVEKSRYTFSSSEVKASQKQAVVTVRRTAGENYFDTIYVGTGEGTANQGADYKAGLKKVDFYAGETEKKISIDILKNEYRTKSRDFYVLLSQDGTSYMKASCHVTIPADSAADAKTLKTKIAAGSAKAEKISPNGWKPENGQWAVSSKDMRYLQGGIWRQKEETRFEGTGGLRQMKINNNDYTYGAKELEFGYYNYGTGKNWTTTHKKWSWKKFKRVTVTDYHHEDKFGTQLWYGGRCMWNYDGPVQWAVCNKSFDNGQWGQDVTIQNWANEGNHSNGYVGWLRLRLKQYSAKCVATADKYYATTYKLEYNNKNKKCELKQESAKNITPVLKIDSISSNVQNSKKNVNGTSYNVYRSDAINFKLENFSDDCMELDGIEASVDGKKWTMVSKGSNLSVVLNADLFKKFDLFSKSTISFRPKVSQRTSKLKFKVANKERGTFYGVENGQEYSLKRGDSVKRITGQGNVAAYNPAFSLGTTWNKNDYNSGRLNYRAAADHTNLTLDQNNTAGNVADVTLKAEYNIVKLDYNDTELTVMADPNTYRNTYTNLKYTIDGKTYDCSDAKQVQEMQDAMEQLYAKDRDATVTMYFEYLANPKYLNGNGQQNITFGNPSGANVNVYDQDGVLLNAASRTVKPVEKNGKYTFTISDTWKKLGWVDGTSCTIQFKGRKQTSLETEVDFLAGSGGYVTVSDATDVLTDSKGNKMGNLARDLVFNNVNPFTDYTMTSYVSPMYIGRWGDYSVDVNNSGNAGKENVQKAQKRLKDLGFSEDLAGSVNIYYGNVFQYKPETYAKSKVYYDFVKRDTSTATDNTLLVQLTQEARTVINPKKKVEVPLTDATVTFAGIDKVSGDEEGFYESEGSYEKGKTYTARVNLDSMSYMVSVQGTGYTKASIDPSQYMFPDNFCATIDGESTGVRTNGNALLDIADGETEFTFGFSNGSAVKPNKAIVTITRKGNEVYKKTVKRDDKSSLFTLSLNTLKAGVKGGDKMTIRGVFSEKVQGKEVDHVYPAVNVGLTFQNQLTAVRVASSFKTPFNKVLKLIGKVSTKFDLPLDYNLGNLGYTTPYTDPETGAEINVIQVAFGYNSTVMKDLKQQQLEHRAENKGEAMSGRDNIRQYMESLMGDDGNDDDGDDDNDDKDEKQTPAPKKDLNESKKAAEKAQESAAPQKSSMGTSSFNFDFSVAVILTVESGVDADGEADGNYYFNSLALIASANADFQYTVSYMTPIGVEIIAELQVGGKAVAAFSAESSNGSRYDDVFNLTKAGEDKTGDFRLNKDNFSLYTKFMLAPTITVGAGVGVGKVINVIVSGTADFDFGFTMPIMGENESSAGYGNVTLSAALKLKILFIKKKWTLYKGEKMSLFNYGASSVGEMLSDFTENYLYEDIDDDSNTEKFARDYLKNQSKWQPYDMSAKAVDAGKEIVLQEGAYPNPQSRIIEIGDEKLLAVFLTDKGDRADINRSELVYSISKDNGVKWSVPVSVSDDGTWDEAPALYKVGKDKVLVTWSDASREYTKEDDTKTVLSQLDISGAWFDIESEKMGEEFQITQTTEDEVMADTDPMIAYDEETSRLAVYYTKTDYGDTRSQLDEKAKEDIVADENADSTGEVTTYGDIINGYNVIACRMGTLKGDNIAWDAADPELPEAYGQRFLDLGVAAVVSESAIEVNTGNTVTVEDENGDMVERPVTETRTVTDLVVDENSDPRVVDSDSISYNGLSIYAYTIDRDANLETTNDQQLYLQIYNFEEDTFHHPIQITADAMQTAKPQFVRCKGMTYLYWLHGGDIQYLNVSDVVSSLNTENSYLEKKQVTMKDQTTREVYVLNKYKNDPVVTAIRHRSETDAEGNVTEDRISDYDVQANDTSMYVLWSAVDTSVKDKEKTGAANTVRETQLYGAYCEPMLESVEESFAYEDTDELTYQFAEGKDNTTYPVSFTAQKEMTLGDGTVLSPGDVYQIDYSKDEDLNGQTGVVKAGDPAKVKSIRSCDGYNWSEPVQITESKGANYTDVSLRVNEDGWMQAMFAKGQQKLNDNNVFEEDEAAKALCVQNFVVTSELVYGEITTDKELYTKNETIAFTLDVTNDGLKPVTGAQYRMYLKNGDQILGEEPEWSALGNVEKAAGPGVFLGGNTVTLSGNGDLNADQIDGTTIVVEIKNGDQVDTLEKKLEEKAVLSIQTDNVQLLDAKTASVSLQIANSGNKDFKGDLTIKDGDQILAEEKDYEIPYGESRSLEKTIDISTCKFGEIMIQEDGSRKDAITLTAEYGDIWQQFEVSRGVSQWEGIAADAVKSISIGQYEITKDSASTDQSVLDAIGSVQPLQKVDGTLEMTEDQVMKLDTIYDVDDSNGAGSDLKKAGLDAKGILNTTWSVSDDSIAYVDENGVLVPLKEGEVSITAKTYPGGEITAADPFVPTGIDGEEIDDFGTLIQSEGEGWFRKDRAMYQVPESLIRTTTIKVKVTKAAAKPTETPAVPTETPTAAPGGTPTAVPTETSAAPGETPKATQKPTMTSAKKTTLKVTVHKKGDRVTVQSLPKAKITTVVYKNKKTALKGKKAGRLQKYGVVKANKKGRITIRLKKKLKKKQAVRVTAVKKPYKQKTVVKVKK